MRGSRHHHFIAALRVPFYRYYNLGTWGVGRDLFQLEKHIGAEPNHTDSQRQAPRHSTGKEPTPMLEALAAFCERYSRIFRPTALNHIVNEGHRERGYLIDDSYYLRISKCLLRAVICVHDSILEAQVAAGWQILDRTCHQLNKFTPLHLCSYHDEIKAQLQNPTQAFASLSGRQRFRRAGRQR